MPDQFKGPDLSDTMKSELDNVLSQFSFVFTNKPGNTISIKTTTTTQIWSPAYTIPVHIEAKFEDELDNFLDDGIIEESDSLWCSPPIPVKKKDMLILIVVYYRKLNSVTVYDHFYMPSTEEMIARLGQAQFLSKLDLAKGFHQVPMADDSRILVLFCVNLENTDT